MDLKPETRDSEQRLHRLGSATNPARSLPQPVRAQDAGLDEGVGPLDRPVDVRLRRKVHDRVELFLAQQLPADGVRHRLQARTGPTGDDDGPGRGGLG